MIRRVGSKRTRMANSEENNRTKLESLLPVVLGGIIAAMSGWMTTFASNRQQQQFQASLASRQESFEKAEAARQFDFQQKQAVDTYARERERLLYEKRVDALKAYTAALHALLALSESPLTELRDRINRIQHGKEGYNPANVVTEFVNPYNGIVEDLIKRNIALDDEASLVTVLFTQSPPAFTFDNHLIVASPNEMSNYQTQLIERVGAAASALSTAMTSCEKANDSWFMGARNILQGNVQQLPH